MTNFRPMKPAAITEADLDNLKYPVIVQPKYDGIRCVIIEGKPLSNRLKPIPNLHIREQLIWQWKHLYGAPYMLDGEIVTEGSFQVIQSKVMTKTGNPDFIYQTFDKAMTQADLKQSYYDRFSVSVFNYTSTKEEVLNRFNHVISIGQEGIIIRSPTSPYKFGRSTINEGYLLKMKRFEDAEARVIGCVELESNLNAPTKNALGLTERSSHGASKYKVGILGALVVEGINGDFKGKQFNIGSGFTNEQRQVLWKNKPIGKLVTYTYQPVGVKTKPRCPIFKGFRAEDDL